MLKELREIESKYPEIYKRTIDEYGNTSENLLPNNFPLSRRFADYKWRDSRQHSTRFTTGVNPIDRFRDVHSAFTIKLYHTHVSFEATNSNPDINIPSANAVHPLTMQIVSDFMINCIDNQKLPADIIDLLDNMQCPFYDGCLVVEVHDYRSLTFMAQKSLQLGGNDRKPQPEIHRILLQPTYQSILNDIRVLRAPDWTSDFEMQVEKEILLATSKPLCLDPSPKVFKTLNAVNYNRNKMIVHREKRQKLIRKEQSAQKKDRFIPRFNILSVLEEYKRRKLQIDSEPLQGLDRKATQKKIVWNIPLVRFYRTLRFEREFSNSKKRYYSLNAILTPNNQFEVILRIGTIPDTSVQGETIRLRLPTLLAVDSYIHNLKFLCSIQDHGIKCTADVTNSSLISQFGGELKKARKK